MMRSSLESQLEDATREFVGKILTILRSASLADVASTQVGTGRPTVTGEREPSTRRRRTSPRSAHPSIDLIPQIVDALTTHGSPIAARTIADQLGVPLDRLAKPLKQLRDEGKIEKRGEKRATKYLML